MHICSPSHTNTHTPSSRVLSPQHPVLDEPIAEAVCIIADTDKWTVQVASSQRRPTDTNKLGKEVLVSSLVSSLLQSTHQLYKLNLSPNFVSDIVRLCSTTV